MSSTQLVLSILQRRLDQQPESKSLRTAISHLSQIETRKIQLHEIPWDIIKHDFNTLTAEGLWEATPENERLLEDLRNTFTSRPTSHTSDVLQSRLSPSPSPSRENQDSFERVRDISVVVPPPIAAPLLPISSVNTTVLPVELVEVLNHTYFLHLLATDPESVLPPGKSLLSVMLQPHAQNRQPGDLPSLHDRVKDLVHRAFWDEVGDIAILSGIIFETQSAP